MLLPRLALALAVGVAAAPALAQPEGPVIGSEQAVSEQARTLFQQGLGFADRGDWERAVERFRHALELRDTPNVRYNLAQSLAQMGRLVEALEELDRVLSFESASDDVREAATSLKADLQPRLGHLLIRVNEELEGSQVTIDGRPIGSPRPPGNVATDPGVRVVRLLRDAEELDVEEVDVPEGGEASVVLEVPPALRAVRLATATDRPEP
ncbi:MAG: tetratricopeptide repeat protein [Pseudomonadota bacterium]